MNRKAIVSAVMAVIMSSTGAVAFAQGKGDRGDRNDRGDRGERSERNDQSQRNGRQDRRDNPGHAKQEERRDERGAGPNHGFHRGDRLPAEYRHRQYVVDDWRGHQLTAPPRGYHWVQTGGDYVLAAIATGVILQLFLNQ